MANETLPLKEMSIEEIYNGDKATYEVPIYQRNFAWEKDEISALVQDVYDAFCAAGKKIYFIGTLVTFHKEDHVYEVIDGQQRLTTIYLILCALGIRPKNKLTYRARKKADNTIRNILCTVQDTDERSQKATQNIPNFEIEEKDDGIVSGFKDVKAAIKEIVIENRDGFKSYFQENVHIIRYEVPKDIDLNHYFEIMNSRGEQLEKHEIVKARLMEKLKQEDSAIFNRIWEACSEMNVYIQQKYREPEVFGNNLNDFIISNFNDLPKSKKDKDVNGVHDAVRNTIKIKDLIKYKGETKQQGKEKRIDTFQPIIDFPNFLLIVLKLTRMLDKKDDFDYTKFILDDKELINEFDKVLNPGDEKFVKNFGFNLLKAKYFLDNYIVHHSNEEETKESNPWKLQKWQKEKEGKNEHPKNLDEKNEYQNELVQLLSMFEVTFSARQRKNYLFYCLLHLFRSEDRDIKKYYQFVSGLADKYFKDIYLDNSKLTENNTPKPGSFDETILPRLLNNETLNIEQDDISMQSFCNIYGYCTDDRTEKSKGIPLFIFNYLDYKLWEKYCDELRGKGTGKGDEKRTDFFNSLGCSEFESELDIFKNFYFSKTRRSLEHFYPQAMATGEKGRLTPEQINCFGNYAMIGSQANSSGSNWSPKTKIDHYLDASGKINQVSVASLKFMIMMQICKDNKDPKENRSAGDEWNFDDIKEHQEKMINILLGEGE